MQTLSLDFLLRNLIANLMMPPLLWIFIAGVALLFIRRRLRLQRILVGICLLMIWVTSTTAFANWFVAMSGNWLDYGAPIHLSDLNVGQSDLTQDQLSVVKGYQAQVFYK